MQEVLSSVLVVFIILSLMQKCRVVVFSSPKFASPSLKALFPHYEFRPAISPLDVIRAIDEKINVIGVIDYNAKLSQILSLGEILDGLRSGLSIFGASEIGAQRSLEAQSFGMIGVGRIFDKFQKDVEIQHDLLFDDGNAEGYSQVNLYFSLIKNDVDHKLAELIQNDFEQLPRNNRNKKNVYYLLKKYKMCDQLSIKILEYNQQQLDARTLLHSIDDHLKYVENVNNQLWNGQKKQFGASRCSEKWAL